MGTARHGHAPLRRGGVPARCAPLRYGPALRRLQSSLLPPTSSPPAPTPTSEKSSGTRSQKRSGSASPKNTMSGFTRPPQLCGAAVGASVGGDREETRGRGASRAAVPCGTASKHPTEPSLPSARAKQPSAHLLLAVAGVSVLLEHRRPHMLHVMRHAALHGLGGSGRAGLQGQTGRPGHAGAAHTGSHAALRPCVP